MDVLQQDPELWGYISQRLESTTGEDALGFFSNPQKYCGKAVEKTRDLVEKYSRKMNTLKEIL